MILAKLTPAMFFVVAGADLGLSQDSLNGEEGGGECSVVVEVAVEDSEHAGEAAFGEEEDVEGEGFVFLRVFGSKGTSFLFWLPVAGLLLLTLLLLD